MLQDERQAGVLPITPPMLEAGVSALTRLEDEILGVLSSSSLKRLAVGVFEAMVSEIEDRHQTSSRPKGRLHSRKAPLDRPEHAASNAW